MDNSFEEMTNGEVINGSFAVTEREKGLIEDIKKEFITQYPKNFAGEPELGGCACTFSLNKVLDILDKYKEGSF